MLFIATILVGCKPRQDVTLCEENCIKWQQDSITVQTNVKQIIVEQAIELSITSAEPVVSAKLEGISMDMGIIPLHLKAQQDENKFKYNGQIWLGICSQPNMNWLLTVETERNTYHFEFTSQWPNAQP